MSDVFYADPSDVRAYGEQHPTFARCRRLGHVWLEAEDVRTMAKALPADFVRALGLKKRKKEEGGGYDENIGCGRCYTVKTHILDSHYSRIDDHPVYEYPEGYNMEPGTGIIGREERNVLRATHYRLIRRGSRSNLRVVGKTA